MPLCACFHEFELTPDGAGRFLLVLDAEGHVPLLADILGPSGLAAQSRFGLGASYNLTGVQDEQQVNDSLSPFRRRIVIGLDQVDQCYALGPYSVRAVDGVWDHPEFGEAVRRAKYAKDQSARVMLSRELANFAKSHPGMRSVAAVAAPPKFDPEEPNLPLAWARSVAESLDASIASARKTRPTGPQKDLEGLDDERDVADRVNNSVQVDDEIQGNALVIDDTIRSGGMVREMGRALKAAGADKVYALCVAKDAKFTNGGLNLSRERWL